VHQLLVDVIHVASCQFQRVGAVTDLRHGSVLLGVRIICAQSNSHVSIIFWIVSVDVSTPLVVFMPSLEPAITQFHGEAIP
jgi:hypothetical protein